MKVFGIIGKIVGIILLIIVLFIIIGIITVTILTKSNNGYKGDYKAVLESSEASAPKALVVYQPAKSKGSKEIADKLAEGLNAAGYEVTLTYPGKHLSEDITEYSLVAFGSPVFFGKPSTAITDTIKKLTGLVEKTVIVYSVGQMNDSPEMDILKDSLSGKEPDYTEKFVIKDGSKDQKAYDLGLKAGKESRGNK